MVSGTQFPVLVFKWRSVILRSRLDEHQLATLFVSASYGMTEGNAVLAVENHSLPYDEHSIPSETSVYTPTPRAKIRICIPGKLTILKWGQTGELHIGGAPVTRKRYIGMTTETLYEDRCNVRGWGRSLVDDW